MKNELLQLNISEWLTADRSPKKAIVEFIQFMAERNWRSFELELSNLLESFLGHGADHSSISEKDDAVFTSCLIKDDLLVFVDIEKLGDEGYLVELDIFAPDSASLERLKQTLIEDVMRCFGLTSSKESLVQRESTTAFPNLRERLRSSAPITDALYQQLKNDEERAILRELKKRGAVLERDFHELQLTLSPERITRVLDYFSGEEFGLVERKFAIVCTDTQEIIFLLQSKAQIENVAPLQCPKCARQINNETVMPYYSSTDELKALLDGNRWMPLLVRDSLIKTGVPKDDILTEVKHSEDEIDVLVFYHGRVFVIELKNRPVNLNDAYKLSAKTSRLESVLTKANVRYRELARKQHRLPLRSRGLSIPHTPEGSFIPVVITTHEVAKDAMDLLKETRDIAQFLEQSEGKIDEFIKGMIGNIEGEDLARHFNALVSLQADSVEQLASNQIGRAFESWRVQKS